MSKLDKVDYGSQCHRCGKYTESKYKVHVVFHHKHKQYLQQWCVECVAKAKPGTVQVQTIGELGRDGKLIQVGG